MGELNFEFESPDQIDSRMFHIAETAKKGLARGKVVLTLGRESRTKKQNAWFHALIGDIKKEVRLDIDYSLESWKALLVDEFELELKSEGRKLPKPSHVVISLDKQRAITVRASTSSFGKRIAGEFITFLYAWGTLNGVDFSQNSKRIYEDHGVKPCQDANIASKSLKQHSAV